ncbi:CIA30 family protein [uncultured Polaribacter sp.]|uniref:CIA30 family protein n=1 Tax=uncultured Polaribacter sp. TaxID=174711 RepID=UPI0026353430|nr:CIA30 family protein [uncultured Polaribacter sp.]
MSDTKIVVFDFNSNSNITNWRVVDDVVMGGRSQGNFKLNEEGKGSFYGNVSLENNGGFSSLRYRFKELNIKDSKYIVLKVKGDGSNYQFRVKDAIKNAHSYVHTFSTEVNKWKEIVIPLKEMYPAFRGRKLDLNNFSANTIEEIAFLIGNKKAQNFQLEIDIIYLK